MALLLVSGFAGAADKVPLPLPTIGIPDNPSLVPTVVTGEGQRLLLNDTEVQVAYEPKEGLTGAKALVVNRPGWWVINYPLDRISGLEERSAGEIAQLLFERPAAEVRNWYVRTPGEAASEPAKPSGPTPIDLTPNPTIIVDGGSSAASDSNPGTVESPLKTIGAAAEKAKPGDTVHVMPGVYRESVQFVKDGRADAPIRIEGVRGANGQMPVITGNDPFPQGAFEAVDGLPGVWRAPIFTDFMGTLSKDGETLIERSVPQALEPMEYCFNRGSKEFLKLRFDGKDWDETVAATTPKVVEADAEGFLDLKAAYGEAASNAVVWVSTYVWLPPKKKETVWDPRFPEPINQRVVFEGRFRAFRMAGAGNRAQVNKFRVWANGGLLPSCVYCTADENPSVYRTEARANRLYGHSEKFENFPLKEGWNHLVFQLDTTTEPESLTFKMTPPKGVDNLVSSASKPQDMSSQGDGEPKPYVSAFTVYPPLPGEPDVAVYVRLAEGEDANAVGLDLASRNLLVDIQGDYLAFRGFEIRHGAQFQQRSQVKVFGEGTLLEGCLIRDSEFGGITFHSALTDGNNKTLKDDKGNPVKMLDQTAEPTIIRGNWILNPGNVGIGASCESEYLTPENQSTTAPGRSPFIVEHNVIENFNWGGIPPFWAAGGMKVFQLTGCVIRYNTVIGGTGMGIWQDWEHYGNRLEGNLSIGAWATQHSVEASPGPNLIANCLCVDLRPGEVWFRWAHLAWSSARTWAVNNTVDGRWNKTPAWQNKDGADGIRLGYQGGDRGTRWGDLPTRKNALYNNLIVGCDESVDLRHESPAEANYTDRGKGAAMQLGEAPAFRDPEGLDYRLSPESPLNKKGVSDNETVELVRHDYYGLLRFDEDGRTVGAFRAERESAEPGAMVEIETADGSPLRLYNPK